MTQVKTILIADDDLDLCRALAARFHALGLVTVTANDASSAIQITASMIPSLICLDVDMPRGNGLAVCDMIRSDEKLSDVPVIVMTGKEDEETVRRCHNLCAYYVTKSADIWGRLEPLVGELLGIDVGSEANTSRDRPTCEVVKKCDPILDAIFSALGVDERYFDGGELPDDLRAADLPPGDAYTVAQRALETKPWILHVDDDTELSNALKMRLEAHGLSVVQAFDGIEGVRRAFTRPAAAIILDYQMPHGNGEYVLRRLKQCEATRHIPVIVLTGHRDQDLEQQMLTLGASRFLSKPVRFDVILQALSAHVPLQEPRGATCLMA